MTIFEDLNSIMNCGYSPVHSDVLSNKIMSVISPNLDYYRELSSKIMTGANPFVVDSILVSLGFENKGVKNAPSYHGGQRKYYYSKEMNLGVILTVGDFVKSIDHGFAFFKDNDVHNTDEIRLLGVEDNHFIINKMSQGRLHNDKGVAQITIDLNLKNSSHSYSINGFLVKNYDEWLIHDHIQKVLREIKSNEGNGINL